MYGVVSHNRRIGSCLHQNRSCDRIRVLRHNYEKLLIRSYNRATLCRTTEKQALFTRLNPEQDPFGVLFVKIISNLVRYTGKQLDEFLKWQTVVILVEF
jgi:hypothetical protein